MEEDIRDGRGSDIKPPTEMYQ